MSSVRDSSLICDHCLLPVPDRGAVYDDGPSGRNVFCCKACRAIYRMIAEEGLQDFYAKRDWHAAGIPESLRAGGQDDAGPKNDHGTAPDEFSAGEEGIQETDLMIDGIRCASCVWLNEKILERTDGVVSARVNFATHRALVRWDRSKTTLPRILSRLRSIGYLAKPYTPSGQETLLREQNRDLLLRLGTAFFFSMQLMLFSFGLYAGYFQGIDARSKGWLEFAAFGMATPVLFYSGWSFLRGAVRGARNRTANMDMLVSLGALSAYLLSVYHIAAGGEVYFDTAAMIITLVLLGRYLENTAKRSASQAVTLLLELQPKEARLVRNGDRRIVAVDDVAENDIIEVRPGEKVPLDGVVTGGASEVDESLVTGESLPVKKSLDAAVIGGTVNGLGMLTIRVTRIGRETVIAQIARLVEKAQAAAAPVQRLADRVSSWFVPFVLIVAAGTFLYWTTGKGGASSSSALLNAVSVLVIACPCALGLATPIAILTGTGSAARKGILIKGGDILERLHKVDTVVLDKTGTITTGRMNVVRVRSAACPAENPDDALLQYAASVEHASEHLVGAAIVTSAEERGIPLLLTEAWRARPGLGVSATIHGEPVLAGRKTFLEQEGVSLPREASAEAETWEQQGITVVWVARAGTLLGIIGVADAPKPGSRQAVEALKRRKIDVTMITGDNRLTAHAIADQVGISKTIAGIMPAGKSEEIVGMKSSGRRVAMVGDGINDAPALAAADVGIALSTGSDAAIESADVVLMRPCLDNVVQAVDLSKRTFFVIRQNLFWAFFYNIAAIPLAVSGLLHPIAAAGAMAMSSVTVVANSLRLKEFSPGPDRNGVRPARTKAASAADVPE